MKKGFAAILAILLLLSLSAMAESPSAPLTLTFVENPTTGYTWQVSTSDEAVLSIQDQGYAADPTPDGAVGTGGTHTWVLLGKAAGDATATFTFGQGWDGGEVDTTLVYTCHIANDLSVTVADVSGIPELSMPDKAAVMLLENPTTGYTWTYQVSSEGILVPEKDVYLQPSETLEGAGGQHLWVWSGAKAGEVTLVFAYARSFEPDVAPEATVTYNFTVAENGRVRLNEIGGDYAAYDPSLATLGD